MPLIFWKSARESIRFQSAKFCFPFYRSFYAITFKNQDMEAEANVYLAEARSAVKGSESKEKLLEVVENLAKALKRGTERGDSLNKIRPQSCRRYCERSANLLDTTRRKAPNGKQNWLEKGLPIIDERLKKLSMKFKKNQRPLYKQTKGTPLEEFRKRNKS